MFVDWSEAVGDWRETRYTKLLYLKGHSGSYWMGSISALAGQQTPKHRPLECHREKAATYSEAKPLVQNLLNEIKSSLVVYVVVCHDECSQCLFCLALTLFSQCGLGRNEIIHPSSSVLSGRWSVPTVLILNRPISFPFNFKNIYLAIT